ncbi:MAG: pyruvate dehydrogenase complex dihydrolipoamide acetyltransferase, partial [Alphaproteobacteria bacterium]|nr:pyruvate dehydrogenase complex dihydrolipoamide acetyltransferase [Alphaproteobacteria bacterium]
APAAPRPGSNGSGQAAEGERLLVSPLAKRMAAQAGLDLGAIKGSGPHGRIVKADIDQALAAGKPPAMAPAPTAAAPAPAARPAAPLPAGLEPEFELLPLSAMRKTIARRMQESKQQAPHFYMTVDCEIDALLKLRRELNDEGGGKLTVNDLLIKLAALALMKVPAANAAWAEGGIKLYKSADISVAVATERGLVTPVVRRAEQKGLATISREMAALAAKARDGKLLPEDYQGGTFTISNLGMFGIKQFEAVLNPPQACILAIGAGEKRPVVKNDALAIATIMSCTLSVDHRSADGAIGAQYLAAFKKLVDSPLAMLL